MKLLWIDFVDNLLISPEAPLASSGISFVFASCSESNGWLAVCNSYALYVSSMACLIY